LRPDRPPKADSAYMSTLGHFQYETDLLNFSQTNFGGVTRKLYQAFCFHRLDHLDAERRRR
jgi:hypothetical protein